MKYLQLFGQTLSRTIFLSHNCPKTRIKFWLGSSSPTIFYKSTWKFGRSWTHAYNMCDRNKLFWSHLQKKTNIYLNFQRIILSGNDKKYLMPKLTGHNRDFFLLRNKSFSTVFPCVVMYTVQKFAAWNNNVHLCYYYTFHE